MCNNNWNHLFSSSYVSKYWLSFLSFSGLSTWGRKVGRKFDQIKINDPNEKLHYVVTPPSPASSSIHARPASSICSNSHEDHNCTLLVISIFISSSIVFCKLDFFSTFYEMRTPTGLSDQNFFHSTIYPAPGMVGETKEEKMSEKLSKFVQISLLLRFKPFLALNSGV